MPQTPRLSSDTVVTIVGLGLMGGSLALALRRHADAPYLIGVVRNQARVEEAQSLNVVDEVTTDWQRAVSNAHVVVLATPVRTLIRQIHQIGPYLRPDTLVIDLGSTKRAICQALATLPDHVQPIGGHPMCGKEVAGLIHAEATLYEGATFVLCPLERTANWARELALDLVHRVGARPLILRPDQHDHLVATISHLPYLVAAALVGTTHRVAQEDPRVWRVAASGFRDTTRVASSDVKVMLDILLTNQEAVLSLLERYIEELKALRALLEEDREGELRLYLANIKTLRDAHFGRSNQPVEPSDGQAVKR